MPHKDKIKNIADTLKERSSIRIAQKILKASGLNTARSWDDTIERVDDLSEDFQLKILDELLINFEQNNLYGSKAIKILKIKKSKRDKVRNLFASLSKSKEKSLFDAYPIPVSGDDLNNVSRQPEYLYKYQSDDGELYLFSHKKMVSARQVFEGEELESFGEYAEVFDKIVGLVDKEQIFFNSIFLDKNCKYVEIRVDLADVVGVSTIKEVMSDFEKFLDVIFFSKFKMSFPGISNNLFPVIHEIYNNKNEGYISELSFICGTGVNRTESIRGGKNSETKDIREEGYHIAGTEEIEHVFTPYRTKLYWDEEDDEDLEYSPFLYIPGNISHAKGDSADKLDYAIISRTYTDYEFNYVINVLREYSY
ncbi:hypothetical protein P7M07_02665 [Vibrio parahaemolyticus]|uniref:hypothetical protein n=1 Tax=Vibrio parahaemolyticus TaxID=670 RepID=UPI0004155726|nr:hypothetical protein [Vibrio parahaemolyticus]MDG2671892.1 hypothetical protein [Vibrio parahaemolyticus]HCE3033001.1 hypothetical protein [Vibrio parahaemolyticus]HCE3037253.1 hypothetical protein [Vibrio parahaemolyticus]HCG7347880.1 hypothetical protein [Vibrio parahaemolyticus]HCG7352126.1 hypothetical protein [Vibrio parahaemolyticus]